MNGQAIETSIEKIPSAKIGTLIDLLNHFEALNVPKLSTSAKFKRFTSALLKSYDQASLIGLSTNRDRLDLIMPDLVVSLALVDNVPLVIRSSKLFKL